MNKHWQGWQKITIALVLILVVIGGWAWNRHHQSIMRQQRRVAQQHRLPGTYYAYMHDNGIIHKVRLRVENHHRAVLTIVDSTQGESTHVKKVNLLYLHPHRHTVTAPAYPGAVSDHYRHVGTTIRLRSGGQTTVYYRVGTFRQRVRNHHFIKEAQ